MRSQRLVLGFVAIALVLGLVAPTIAGGQSSPDPRARRDELGLAIEGATAEELKAIKVLQDTTAKRQVLEARVAALDRQIADATQRVEAAEAEIARIAAQIETVQREIDRIKAEIELSKARFNQSTVALYKGATNGSSGSSFTLLSIEGGAHELIAGSKYLGENSRQFDREIRKQGSLKDQLDDAQHDLRKEEAKAREAERVAAEERDRVTQLRGQADSERQQVAAAEAEEQQVIEGLRARRAEFEAEYAAVQEQINAEIAAATSRGNPAPPQAGNGRFVWPVNGPVTSGFGPRRHPIYGGSRMHNGIDITASSGTPIKAGDDGVVVMAGSNGGYGLWTLVDHGGGLATGYAHQSSIGVSMGQRVGRGQVIGRVGSTGASTGPHLHFEVRVNGSPVNPMSWL
jgi:murein DD-endopeptidase MepM/ murein hydrolase activator NlpD